MLCPCNSAQDYEECCKPLHEGKAALTAESLMRSRYSAYVLKLEDYLLKTWHPSKRPKILDLSSDETKWSGLEIIDKEQGGADDHTDIVEFVACFEHQGAEQKLRERSRFVKRSGHWLYKDAI